MATTKIEWADTVWNPVTGCTKVSEGCRHCYAETMATRFWGERKFTDVRCHEDRLDQPLRWKKPRRVFVNSMSDLFHPEVPTRFFDRVLEVIADCPQHVFLVLTKRPERMQQALYGVSLENPCRELGGGDYLPNLWLGVSVENQKAAEERIPFLLKTPAVVRFVSCEPLLGPVDLFYASGLKYHNAPGFSWEVGKSIDWVICGGESGPGARPMHPDWAHSLRDQCQSAGVPFFFKQWGEWYPQSQFSGHQEKVSISRRDGKIGDIVGVYRSRENGSPFATSEQRDDTAFMVKVGKKAAGRLLDGREWNEFPKQVTKVK